MVAIRQSYYYVESEIHVQFKTAKEISIVTLRMKESQTLSPEHSIFHLSGDFKIESARVNYYLNW